jgi:hypothetical protein
MNLTGDTFITPSLGFEEAWIESTNHVAGMKDSGHAGIRVCLVDIPTGRKGNRRAKSA